MYIDVHSHLHMPKLYSKIDRIVKNASRANVINVINCGLDIESNRKVLELSKKYQLIKPALGLYPTESEKMSENEIENEIEFIRSNKPFAISEIGMDLKHLNSLNKQKPMFEKMLNLAEDLNLPVIVHTRKAELETLEILETTDLKIILHCFTGNTNLIKKASENGYFFSVPTSVTYMQELQNLVQNVSINKLMTETDAPFLAPIKGRINEPANILQGVKKIAEIKQMTEKETTSIIFKNYKKVFK